MFFRNIKYYLYLFILLACVPILFPPFYTSLVVKVLIFSIFAMSLDILLGYTGLLSFGHIIGWGIASYVVGIFTTHGFVTNFWVLLLLAVLSGLALNAVLALLALRTSGLYFCLVTLALAEIIRCVAVKWKDITGGVDGISGIPMPWKMTDMSFYYLTFIFFIVCFILMRGLVASKFGKILMGIRENEPRMQALGYNTWFCKYVTILFTGLMAGAAGFLFCLFNRYVGPGDLGFGFSGEALLMVLIGGMGTIIGPFIGAIILVALKNGLSIYTIHWMLILGILFILCVKFFPHGVVGYFKGKR
jgi:branched-chain amino acid transport system permease protein